MKVARRVARRVVDGCIFVGSGCFCLIDWECLVLREIWLSWFAVGGRVSYSFFPGRVRGKRAK